MTEQNTPLVQAIVAVAPGGIPIPSQPSNADNAAHAAGSFVRLPPPVGAFNQHLFLGHANWYRDNVSQMAPDVLQRHQMDLEGKFTLHEKGLLKLSEADRMEIAEALQSVNRQLDEILPKIPAAIDEHDRSVGNRVHRNWPSHFQTSTLTIHLHFCELIDSWRIHPARTQRFTSYLGVAEEAEVKGNSAFNFDNKDDLNAFLEFYQLDDFIVSRDSFEGVNNRKFYHLILSNKFTPDEVNRFMNVYKSAINRLAGIAEERRRAINLDGGRVGFLTIDHFSFQEQVELNHILTARCELGMGR